MALKNQNYLSINSILYVLVWIFVLAFIIYGIELPLDFIFAFSFRR